MSSFPRSSDTYAARILDVDELIRFEHVQTDQLPDPTPVDSTTRTHRAGTSEHANDRIADLTSIDFCASNGMVVAWLDFGHYALTVVDWEHHD